MKIVVATDSFKGTLSAAQACEAVARGLRRTLPELRLATCPLADGGEGTIDAVVSARAGEFRQARVRGPWGESVEARYGLIEDGTCAVIEMAQASGLLVAVGEPREVMRASTFGTGELVRRTLADGARRLLVGIGGSATNDGGTGCAQALGVRFMKEDGTTLPAGMAGSDLAQVARIDVSELVPTLREATLEVLCDVRNPLTGPEGASHVYGPQKGATPEQVEVLDRSLVHLAQVVERDLGIRVAEVPGAGAAGGLGAGLLAFAGGQLRSGAQTVLEITDMEARCANAHAILTGEGCLDEQSLHGKVVCSVAELGRRLGVPVYVLAGQVNLAKERWAKRFAGVGAVGESVATDPARALEECAASRAQPWFGVR